MHVNLVNPKRPAVPADITVYKEAVAEVPVSRETRQHEASIRTKTMQFIACNINVLFSPILKNGVFEYNPEKAKSFYAVLQMCRNNRWTANCIYHI